jgi:tetratricopeptide (TPR) repeat protein
MNGHKVFLTIIMAVAIAAPAVAQPALPVPKPAPAPKPVREDWRIDVDVEAIKAQARAAADLARAEAQNQMEMKGLADKIAFARKFGPDGFAFFQPGRRDRDRDDDRNYERGQRALDGRRWEEALESFSQVASGSGTRVDGALYWKAYALAKLGRRDEATAAIAQLRKTFPQSRWLDDTKALEFEMKQASGQRSAPEAEADEDLKLMALNGLVQSDPDRALPLLENLLKTSSSAKLKERVLFVLAQSNSTAGKQLLERVARGGAGNPDLQVKAVHYISATSKRNDNRALLWDIYSKSTDDQVKREVIRGLRESQDREHLLQIAKSDKEPGIRRIAIESLASLDPATTGDALSSLYGSETDQQIKRQILNSLHGQRNAKAIVEIARKETDPQMKREIVSRLSNMKSKEATDYLMEILK